MATTQLKRLTTGLAAAACLLASASCGEVARMGRSPVYLIIDSLEGSPGGGSSSFGGSLNSDVISSDGVVFDDPGRAILRLGLKNPGTPSSPTAPSSLNQVTLSRYRVSFRRADGRNTSGIDVPFGFDGSLTVTVSGTGTSTASFQLVRHTSKMEPPLSYLIGGGGAGIISTIAEVTFYGRDQAGHDVQVTGQITVNFSDFAN